MSNRQFHAVIVRGGSAAGAFTRALLSETLCSAETGARPCFVCPHCAKVARGLHPDVDVISRQRDENGVLKRHIAIDQIRQAIRGAAEAPNEAARRVIVVEEAEKMRREAQNALLKTLEEPPPHLSLILITDAPGALLPTVRSRCRTLDSGEAPAAAPERATALARAYFAAAERGGARLAEFSFELDKIERDELRAFLDEILRLAGEYLSEDLETGVPRLPRGALADIITAARECGRYIDHNVAVAHISARLAAAV